jgi:serine/threonine-protein kinase RsbW
MGSDWSCSAVFPGTVSGVVDAACWIERLSADRGFPEGLSFGIQLCVEELLTNVVRHGGGAWLENAEMPAAAAPGVSISIGIMRSDDVIILVIEDDGTPFDITAAPAKPVHRRVEEAQPGGLGIPLVRSFSSGLTYDRTGGLNRTTLRFLWPRTAFALL